MDKEIILVNNLIGAAVMHGSDAGGSVVACWIRQHRLMMK